MRTLGVGLLVLCLGGSPVAASAEASLGSTFADAYARFAPLEALHRSFADHLFAGSPIAVPRGLASCCAEYLLAIQTLHEELIIQTTSDVVEALGAVVRLRLDAEAFCSAFSEDLAALDSIGSVPDDVEDRLVEQAFFARIHELDERFRDVLDAGLLGVADGEPRWAMGVTFAVRALLVNPDWTRIPGTDLPALFYGASDPPVPLFEVPETVGSAMAAIVAVAGRDLDASERMDARASALAIYEHFMGD